MAACILVVDDERRIREVVHYALEREGYRVRLAENAREAQTVLQSETVDLIVLDVMLPDKSGLDLCREFRSQYESPILFLSARSEEIDRVVGLELGADDYLGKPFGTRELVARVKAVLRRTGSEKGPGVDEQLAAMVIGDLALDESRHEVLVKAHTVDLTHTEFLILATMMRRPGVVFERGQLMRSARNDDTHITERTVDTHVRRIRAKLREQGLSPITTVHGVGYKLAAEACSVD